MKKKFKIGIIGAGFMAKALIERIIDSKLLKGKDIIVSARTKESLDKLAKYKVNTTLNNVSLASNSEFVLFAVKPQNSKDVFKEIKNCDIKKIISIMAGVKIATIKKYFRNALVSRVMPNTPCSLGKGAIGADYSEFTDKKDIEFIEKLLGTMGYVLPVKEGDISAVIGLAGSAPAYFYMFIKGMVDAGIRYGLKEEDAKLLATNTMIGSGEMILNCDKPLDELISNVCSKGGTTIEAVKVFNDKDLNSIVNKAIDACIDKSKELEEK